MSSGAVNALARFGRFEAGLQFAFLACIAMSCCFSGIKSLDSPDPKQKSQSLLFIGGGACLLLIGYLIFSFAQQSRTGAAVMGGLGAFNIAESIIN